MLLIKLKTTKQINKQTKNSHDSILGSCNIASTGFERPTSVGGHAFDLRWEMRLSFFRLFTTNDYSVLT